MMELENKEKKALQHAATRASASSQADEMEQLYRAHASQVFRAAYRVTGSAQDAEDVLQTVFLRLVRKEGGSGLSDTPGHYLHRAAVNAALDIVRARRSARAVSLEQAPLTLAEPADRGPDQAHSALEIREQVRRALGDLSPKTAEIFILRYFEGYANHEIAGMVGASRSTIAVVLHRARRHLRDAIRSYVGDRT
jgi:RNA polymerase sigma-70 factor (ECF subfamily)